MWAFISQNWKKKSKVIQHKHKKMSKINEMKIENREICSKYNIFLYEKALK